MPSPAPMSTAVRSWSPGSSSAMYFARICSSCPLENPSRRIDNLARCSFQSSSRKYCWAALVNFIWSVSGNRGLLPAQATVVNLRIVFDSHLTVLLMTRENGEQLLKHWLKVRMSRFGSVGSGKNATFEAFEINRLQVFKGRDLEASRAEEGCDIAIHVLMTDLLVERAEL